MTEAFHDGKRARGLLRKTFGSTAKPLAAGVAKIARAQLRQRRGRPAGHPGT
jgi:hypothetical protein